MGDAADDAEVDAAPATAAKRAASYASKSRKQQKKSGVPDDFFVYGNRYRLEEPSNAYRELRYGPGVQAKHWRDQDKMVSTSTLLDPSQGGNQERAKVLKKLKPDLFGTGVAQSLAPLDSYLTAKALAVRREDERVGGAVRATSLVRLPTRELSLEQSPHENKVVPADLGGPAKGQEVLHGKVLRHLPLPMRSLARRATRRR